MQKSMTIWIQLLAAGSMLLGNALAQQTPAAPAAQPTKPASSTPATAAKKAPVTTKSASTLTLTTQKQKASYALGMKIGGDLRKQKLNEALDSAITARGLRDALSGAKAAMTEDEEKAALTQLQTEMRAKHDAETKLAGAAGHKEGDAFLAANKTKDGVVTLPDGLQYKILTAGTGAKPAASDTVTVNYKGTLIDGTEFDSSYKRGQPASFPVGGVIKGWTEALQLMPVGSKWQLFIPSDLAYGDAGRPGIPPAATLVFEVELISIGDQKKDEPKK
jgi:FKBP-type peptidyl-prolyl cis-trans isomerase